MYVKSQGWEKQKHNLSIQSSAIKRWSRLRPTARAPRLCLGRSAAKPGFYLTWWPRQRRGKWVHTFWRYCIKPHLLSLYWENTRPVSWQYVQKVQSIIITVHVLPRPWSVIFSRQTSCYYMYSTCISRCSLEIQVLILYYHNELFWLQCPKSDSSCPGMSGNC